MTKYYVTSFENIHTNDGLLEIFENALEAYKFAFDNSEFITDEDEKLDSCTDGYGKIFLKEIDPENFYCYMLEHSQPNDGRGLMVLDEEEYNNINI